MNGTQIFDTLLERRKITLVADVTQSQSLRVSMIRKFKDYKEQMTALGFLDPALEDAVVSLEYDSATSVAKFFLRAKKRVATEFTIIPESDETDTPS
jgi:hypothetical protein